MAHPPRGLLWVTKHWVMCPTSVEALGVCYVLLDDTLDFSQPRCLCLTLAGCELSCRICHPLWQLQHPRKVPSSRVEYVIARNKTLQPCAKLLCPCRLVDTAEDA